MIRVILKHLTGARAPEVDVVSLSAHTELILGSGGSAAVRYDPRLDERLGKWHASIIPVEGLSGRYVLVDLDSRNGTFVNGRKVADAVVIRPGDILQLGEGGPEIEFQVEEPLL